MKIGDKVRFLNAIGGGVVTGFQGKDIVLVEDEDGFDIPVLIRECVVVQPAGETEVQVRQSVKAPAPSSMPVIEKQEEPIIIEETKEGEQLTVCLAYLPTDMKNLSSTDYEAYLVNDSNYFLSYNYMSRSESGWISRSNGVIEPNMKLFLEEFGKEDLNDLEKVCLQFIAYKKDKPFQLKNSYSVDVRIDTVKFYKLHSFRENDYFDEEAIIYYVAKRDLAEKGLTISPEELSHAMMEKSVSERPKRQKIHKKQSAPILEVDLHIDKLLDTTAGLSSADMLEYQLSKFREVMDANLKQKGQKIVFIHGKGNGTLKSTIMNDLKNRYKSVYYQDASFREYGFGATMITIR